MIAIVVILSTEKQFFEPSWQNVRMRRTAASRSGRQPHAFELVSMVATIGDQNLQFYPSLRQSDRLDLQLFCWNFADDETMIVIDLG